MKVGVVGNSHLGRLASALRSHPPVAPVSSYSFWGLPGPKFYATRVSDDGFIENGYRQDSKDSARDVINGRLNLSEFDTIVFVAEPIAMPFLMLAMKRGGMPAYKVSESVLDAVLEEWLNSRGIWLVVCKTRKHFDGRIITIQQPMFRGKARRAWFKPIKRESTDRIIDWFKARLERDGIEFLRQPPETLNKQGMTFDHLSLAAEKLGVEEAAQNPEHDAAHMGSSYAELVATALERMLATPQV
jgi:hypothetical protein